MTEGGGGHHAWRWSEDVGLMVPEAPPLLLLLPLLTHCGLHAAGKPFCVSFSFSVAPDCVAAGVTAQSGVQEPDCSGVYVPLQQAVLGQPPIHTELDKRASAYTR